MTQAKDVSSKGKQDYETPWDFVHICEKTFGVKFILDCAASAQNAKAPVFLTEDANGLTTDWKWFLDHSETPNKAAWLNPPFRNCGPWMQKCAFEGARGSKIVTLTLSSLGTQWYKKHVKPNALSFILEDRLTFVGQDAPYTKELMISLFGFGMTGLCWWNWKAP